MTRTNNYSGSMRNTILEVIFEYYVKVTAPRYGVNNWDFTGELYDFRRLGVNFHTTVRLFNIPKHFGQIYPSGLSQSNLKLDYTCKRLYRASTQLKQLAFKSYCGPADDIDPEDMLLMTFLIVMQDTLGKEALKLLQTNINRALRKAVRLPLKKAFMYSIGFIEYY